MAISRRSFLGAAGLIATGTQLPSSFVLPATLAETPVAIQPAIDPIAFAASMQKMAAQWDAARDAMTAKRDTYYYLENDYHFDMHPATSGSNATLDLPPIGSAQEVMSEYFAGSLKHLFDAVKPFYDQTRALMTDDPVRVSEIRDVMRRATECKMHYYEAASRALAKWDFDQRQKREPYEKRWHCQPSHIYGQRALVRLRNNYTGSIVNLQVQYGREVPAELRMETNGQYARMHRDVEALANAAKLDATIVDSLTDAAPKFLIQDNKRKYNFVKKYTESSDLHDYDMHEFLDNRMLFSSLAKHVSEEVSQNVFIIYCHASPKSFAFPLTQMEPILQREYRRAFENAFPGVPLGSDIAPLPAIDTILKEEMAERMQKYSHATPQAKPEILSETAAQRKITKKGIRAVLERNIAKTLLQVTSESTVAIPPLGMSPDTLETARAQAQNADVFPPKPLEHTPIIPSGNRIPETPSHAEKIAMQRNAQETDLDNNRLP
jgi:hypothetical protein